VTASTAAGHLLFLTHADTDVLAVASIRASLDPQLPPIRVLNIGGLRDEAESRAFFETHVPGASIILVKLHGGVRSLPGFTDLVRLAADTGAWLVAMPGTDELDPELTAYSTAGVPVAHEAKAYFQLGGLENYRQCLNFLSDHLLATGIGYAPPAEQPRSGVYHPRVSDGTLTTWRAHADPSRPTVGVTFYRSYWLTGDTSFIDTLVQVGDELEVNVLPVFAYSLKDGDAERWPDALRYFVDRDNRPLVDVVINTMSFAMGSSTPEDRHGGEWAVEALLALDVPQLQAINASVSSAEWVASEAGLSPLDVAMNVAIPELDGRIIGVPLSFKEVQVSVAEGSPVVRHVALPDRAARILGQARRLAILRRKANSDKRLAIVLTNHNAKAARIANAVGLDSPASLVQLLQALRAAGYHVGDDLPSEGDTLMADLVERGHYDRDFLSDAQLENAIAQVPSATYAGWFAELPAARASEMRAQWGSPPGVYYTNADGSLALAGLRFGNVFVAVQPPRGYGMDKTAIMHKPDLAPTYPYHALYRWLAAPSGEGGFGADAVLHMGKHGSLEWLPGKGVGLSAECYPDLFLGDLPMIYPFIVDDPGEGAAAKRRAHAVIVDHLPPPMTIAETYGDLEQLERLVDEYYLLEKTDPDRLPLLQQQIRALLDQANLEGEIESLLREHAEESGAVLMDDPLSLTHLSGADFADVVEDIHAYMHELGMAPIREGLHVLGQAPHGDALIDTVQMLVRLRNGSAPSLRDSIGAAYGFPLRAALKEPGARLASIAPLAEDGHLTIQTNADAIEAVQTLGRTVLQRLLSTSFEPRMIDLAVSDVLPGATHADGLLDVRAALTFVCERLVPALRRTDEEVTHVLDALDGRYVPPGPSGAPTRGMAHVLPSGRNFYSVDPRAVPSSTAWIVGADLARGVVERYSREEGLLPESVGISIWGTAAMRTSGDDIAQVLALLGVRPVWQLESRRVIGVEVIPLEELGRPRIDVVCRISGFFRDAFPHTIALLDDAFDRVARLDEPLDHNFPKAHRQTTADRLRLEGLDADEAWQRAGYRIFGSKPGTYGAGILQLVDEQAWRDDADLAQAYVNWGGYAYTRQEFGVDARDAFQRALSQVSVAVKNQDNREHDIFDSDDYFQFHGGMIATIRNLTGRSPRAYFGDTQDPDRPRVRALKDEANRVFRSRVVNPKWLAAIRNHGYKGGLEVAATVDYLFGYDATAQVVDDWQYEQVARSYVLDPVMQEFFARSNPWAMKDVAERLLEAIQRGMWAAPDEGVRAALEEAFLAAEGSIEGGRQAGRDWHSEA
jgi:cobaltochelatase CobN